jgi:peptidyl-prolyl cis-trans isomerase D
MHASLGIIVKNHKGDIMLKILRNKKIMKFIMWSLVVIFAAWGVGSVAMSRRIYAGTIFGRKISLQEYNKSYGAVLNRARMVYGEQLPKMEKFLNLRMQAWDRLILLYAAAKKRIKASNKEVIEKIASFDFFRRNNAFDRNLYEYIVTSVFRTSPRNFEESVRGDIIIDKLITYLTKDVALTDEEILDAYRIENEFADISLIIIEPDAYKNAVSVEETEILSFYENNKDKFLKPAWVNAIYLRIPFNNDKEDARFAADELWAESKKGKSLRATAKKYGLEISETGNLYTDSDVSEMGLSYSFILAAFTLNPGDISDIIEMEDSFCIMELKSRKGPEPFSYNQVKEKVRESLIYEKALLIAHDNAREFLLRLKNNSMSLEQLAGEYGLDILQEKRVSRKKHPPLLKEAVEAAFALEIGNTGGPIKTSGGYAVIRLDSITHIDEESYSKDKGGFAAGLLENKKNEVFQKWFSTIKDKADLKDNL